MENINLFTELINSVGFPIVMVAYFIWDKTKVTNKLVTVIENNNVIMNKLLVKNTYMRYNIIIISTNRRWKNAYNN